ncbi:MAG: phosphatidylserine decarboxylase, partial [Schwartzia sp.]|nr:phosphatidylserine decarboxylase [Schwartzia sp. (in: firmicutes)]
MKKRFLAGIVLCAFLLSVWTVGISKGFAAQVFVNPAAPMVQTRVRASESFRDMLEKNPEVQALVVKSIAKAAEINPDRVTNPAQSLDELYSFLDYTVTCMPWNILQEEKYDSFATKCDQSILYVYWLLDQPLEELEGKGLFYPSVEYLEPVYKWLTVYNNKWREYLDTEKSWKQEYLDMLMADPTWNLDKGWYEPSDKWHTFNEFFSRRLANDAARPIAAPEDDSVVVSPADSLPQGVWQIDKDGRFFADPIMKEDGVTIKSSTYVTVEQLLGEPGAAYAKYFYNGILTHT